MKKPFKKLYLIEKSKYPNARIIEIERADIEKDLFIQGIEEEDDEQSKIYKIDPKA